MWSPPVALALWTGSYLTDCLHTLEAPGIPLRFVYTSPGGAVTFTAASYTLDIDRGTLRLTRPRLVNPDGQLLAGVSSVDVEGLRTFLGEDRSVRAHLRDLHARLVRLESGKLEVERYLPPAKEQQGGVPFEIIVDRARLTAIDQVGVRYRQDFTTEHLEVSGVGDDWLAGGIVKADGLGAITLGIRQIARKGILVQAKSPRLQLAPVLNHLATTPEFIDAGGKGLRARTLVAMGPFEAFLPKRGAPRVNARLVVKGEDIVFQEERVNRGVFRGSVNESGAFGTLQAVLGGAEALFKGSANFGGKQPRVAGRLVASVSRKNVLPRRVEELIPEAVAFTGARFEGWVDAKSADDYHVHGTANADTLAYAEDKISRAAATVRVEPKLVAIDVQNAEYVGQRLTGALAINPQSKAISGGVHAADVPIAKVASRFKVQGFSGRADLAAVLQGTLQKPEVVFYTDGTAFYRRGSDRIDLGEFQAEGSWARNALTLRRAVARGPLGLIAANGTIGAEQNLGIGIVGRQLRPSPFFPDLQGEANFVAQVGGTLKAPHAEGYLEGYNFSYGGRLVPAIRADLTADRRRVVLDGVRAVSGTADLTGKVALALRNQALAGKFRLKGLQIADLAPEDSGFAGVVNVPSINLSGTLTSPRATAQVTGQNLVARGAKIDQVDLSLTASPEAVVLTQGSIRSGEGLVTAVGQYSVPGKLGEVNAEFQNIELDPLAKQISSEITLNGNLDGHATATVGLDGLLALTGKGQLKNVRVNGTLVGDGTWSTNKKGTSYAANARIGTIDRYVEVENGSYNPYTRQVGGVLWLNNFPGSDLVAMANRYLTTLSFDAQDAIHSLTAEVDIGAKLTGTIQEPSVEINSFLIDNLNYRSTYMGSISLGLRPETAEGAPLARIDAKSISLEELALKGPLGRANLWGSVELNGEMDVNAEVQNIDLAYLSKAVPQLASAGGRVENLTAWAHGETKKPKIRASATISELFSRPGQAGLSATLSTVRIADGTGIDVTGIVKYRGFNGALEAHAPFGYDQGIPDDQPLSATLQFPERSLDDVAESIPSLDRDRSELGKVSGKVALAGTLKEPQYQGEVKVDAKRLALVAPPTVPIGELNKPTPVQDTIDNFGAAVSFDNGSLRLRANGESSRGGAFTAEALAPLDDLIRLGTGDEKGRSIMDAAISGSLTFEQLAMRQAFAGNTYVAAKVDGRIDLGGRLGRPMISSASPLLIEELDTIVPMFEPATGDGSTLAIDPRFNLQFSVPNPARIRTTAAELYLTGDGTVNGLLSSPDLKSALQVEKGTLTLPGGRIRLEQGGSVDVALQPSPTGPVASAVVDMEGTTSITALRFGSTYERYTITLGVSGDLLKEGGLNLQASSDPPDLSRDRILALLGQTDLLEAISKDLGSADTEKRIRNALVGYALPSLSDPLTNRFARGLGLDYLTLEYNPFEQASVAFAKALKGGFFLQGRRQISDPPPGFPLQYDLRLVYRPRRVRGALSRVSFSLGADEETSIKFAIEYGVRF